MGTLAHDLASVWIVTTEAAETDHAKMQLLPDNKDEKSTTEDGKGSEEGDLDITEESEEPVKQATEMRSKKRYFLHVAPFIDKTDPIWDD